MRPNSEKRFWLAWRLQTSADQPDLVEKELTKFIGEIGTGKSGRIRPSSAPRGRSGTTAGKLIKGDQAVKSTILAAATLLSVHCAGALADDDK